MKKNQIEMHTIVWKIKRLSIYLSIYLSSVYDGLDEYSPLIAKFCGTGFFPRSIIGKV